MNRREIIENFHQMRKEESNIKKKDEEASFAKLKMDITNRQQTFLSSINFEDVKTITKHNESSYLLFSDDSNYDIYNHQITYSIEYNNGLVTKKKDIIKKVFLILYTKAHFIEFLDDDIEIIHFVKIAS